MEKKRKHIKLVVFISIGVLIIAAGLAYLLLSYSKVKECVSIEAGAKMADVTEFLKNKKNKGSFETDITALNLSMPGVHELYIKVGRKVYMSQLQIVDTIAPTASVIDKQIWNDEKLEAKDFVKDIVDATDVKVLYKEEPDFTKVGENKVTIILEDTSGNKTELTADLKVISDTDIPVITGVQDKTVYVDSTVSYRKDVTVTDNKDKEIELTIDSSAVNLKKAGSYKVVYSAVDSAGNTATKTATINVKAKPKGYVDQAELDKLADGVLASIIKSGMSQREKAQAIYRWTKSHIRYVDYSDKSSWMKAAYQGLKKRSGDCFNYASTAKELLTRAGIQNIDIVRKGGGHYWNLVNCGNGWYHFDTTPRYGGGEFFMLTDSQLKAYSAKHQNSHVWDKTKYPATPAK